MSNAKRDPFDGRTREECWAYIQEEPLPWKVCVRVWRPEREGEGHVIKHNFLEGQTLPQNYIASLLEAAGHPVETVRIKIYRSGFAKSPIYDRQQNARVVGANPLERTLELWRQNKDDLTKAASDIKGFGDFLESIGGSFGRGVAKELRKEIKGLFEEMSES